MSGIAWYNILANPVYVRAFNYMTVSMDNREDFIVDDNSDEEDDCEQSDMVKVLCNLAYIRPDVAKDFQFEQGYSQKFGAAMNAAK